MKIKLKEITVRDLVKGYKDEGDEGVRGYGGKLDIRPPYQRNFVYKPDQRNAVIETLRKDFPLNVMYWSVRDDGNYEIIDGQQRTISICEYVEGDFSVDGLYFHNLQDDEQNQILDYKLMVYFCEGTDSERLAWFKTINIAGVELSDQELRNAVYHGSWVTDAKRYFSKVGGPASGVGGDYLSGSVNRQEFLETAIKWIKDDKETIEHYMGKHQQNKSAEPLWDYFNKVIDWVEKTFPEYRKKMKGLDWGRLYKEHKDKKLDAKKLEKRIAELIQDDDVTDEKGIYEYVLTGNEKHLNIRAFDSRDKQSIYEKQGGKCANKKCPHGDKEFAIGEMEADHITPWSEGGKTEKENCQMLCKECNRRKGAR